MNSRSRRMVELCKNVKDQREEEKDDNVLSHEIEMSCTTALTACEEEHNMAGTSFLPLTNLQFPAWLEEGVCSTSSVASASKQCSQVKISENIVFEPPSPSTEFQLTTPQVKNSDNVSLEPEELPLSPQSPFSSAHSEYVPEDLSVSSSSESDNIPLSRLRGRLAPESILQVMEIFPEATLKPRKRLLKQSEWKRNIAKEKRSQGKEYVSSRNKIVPAVKMNPPCRDSCRKKCFLKIRDEDRRQIFKTYWDLASYSRQRDFIQSNTTKEETRVKTKGDNNSKRSASITFFLPIHGNRVQVCKTIFINTLGVKKGVVDIAMKKRTLENTTIADERGKHIKRVTPQPIIENIKRHIESFPSVPSHYCRSGSKRQYLCSSLNITLMYKLYCNWCEERNEQKASEAIYRKTFNNNYNLGFHRPRKDQCRLCMSYHNASADEKKALENDYNSHILTKELARTEKRSDKTIAEESNRELICANFDLQQVLLVPTDPTNNALFYKRRLATYNFTVYNVVSQQGDCYMWSEIQGKRGSCEIASCVRKFLKSLPISTKKVTFYSDRCGGQNLNKFMAAMCMTAVQEIKNIEIINLKFLVVGHSEMKCDSMHAAISREFKRVGKALWPEDWKNIARSARRKGDKPYNVHDIGIDEIHDYKKFVEQNMSIRKTDESGGAVNWQKMCWLRFDKVQPFIMEFKETFDGEFKLLNCNKKTRRHFQPATQLQRLYKCSIPISELKYQNLISLFAMKPPALNDSYRPFYYNLPYNGKVQDTVSESEEELEI